MDTFEYRTVELEVIRDSFDPKILALRKGSAMIERKTVEQAFNELGKEGWELVSVTPLGMDINGWAGGDNGCTTSETSGRFYKVTAFFKRRRP